MKRFLWLVLALGACQRPTAPPRAPKHPDMHVDPPLPGIPLAIHPPNLEQHDDEPLWQQAMSTGPWRELNASTPARPFSQARMLWDAQNLYLSLYAADQNIQADDAQHDQPLWLHDAFSLRIQADLPQSPTYAVEIAPTGTVTDLRLQNNLAETRWESEARVVMDMDGTLNDAQGEDDEEWVAFVALPWANLGIAAAPGTRVHLQFSRCDVPKDGIKRCGEWVQTVVLNAGGGQHDP